MARFIAELPEELISYFSKLETMTEEMLGSMVQAGATTVLTNVTAKMPPSLRNGLSVGDEIRLTKVYKTPSDDGINCQVMIDGYFVNRNGKKTPAPLVANMFEYGSSKRKYPKQPFFRQSFNSQQITEAMLKIQEKYIKEA